MLPTPSTSHVDYNRIYEPAEDSYLLLDTLSSTSEIAFLSARFSADTSPLVLEVGTGSGVVLAFVTAHADKLFGRSDVVTLGTDLNPFACLATRETVLLAVQESIRAGIKPGVFVDSLNGDLTASMRAGSVDLLIFNPPYVPSESLTSIPHGHAKGDQDSFERESQLLYLSTDGGVDGMETTNRLLSQLESVLSNLGVAYILLCAQNRPDAVMTRILDGPGHWFVQKVGSSGKQAGWERLCVLRVWRSA